ncbi:hypothetical protein CRUP_009999 [Coryphaenoides rupestris]|nr:hypothetical protein CRUP_009999 [Coryphaenoides rupestris]
MASCFGNPKKNKYLEARMDEEMGEDVVDLPAREEDEEEGGGEEDDDDDDDDSWGDQEFDWIVENDDIEDEDGDEDDEEEEEGADQFESVALDTYEIDTPPERSGHIAVVDRNCMYVWGGYKNAVNHGFFDLYLPRNELWEYNMETGVWTRRITGGNLFTSMSGSCGVCVDGVLYLFAGHHARGNINRIFCLNLRAPHLTWEEMKDLKGLPPSCKDKLGCWWNSPSRGWNNHIHILDLETSTWSQPITKGNTPSPRAAHACATMGNRGYVFGGRYKNFRLNDLYYIDMDAWEWHEMSVPQGGPSGRSWHSFTPVLWHTACPGPDGEVFVFGGCANNLLSRQRAAHSNKLLVFNVQPKSLVRYCMQVALQHRERLASSWEYLPKHLLHSLQQRAARAGTTPAATTPASYSPG